MIAVGSERILVDTGAGGDFMPTLGRLTDKLEAAGIAADSITKVVFTHGHPDHLWGVVDPFDGGSRFTKARHVMSRIERDYWMTSGIEDKVPPAMKAMAVGTVRRLKELGDRIEPVALDAEIATGVGLLDTRGHTPGHVAVLVRSGSNQALIVGDALTHAIVSFQHPEWRWGSDADPDVAIATRRRLLDMLAREKTALLGYHLAYPGVGRVEATGSAHRFIPG